jgi:hypothetical protein
MLIDDHLALIEQLCRLARAVPMGSRRMPAGGHAITDLAYLMLDRGYASMNWVERIDRGKLACAFEDVPADDASRNAGPLAALE